MNETHQYDATETMSELDAGVFMRKVSRALAEAAMAVVSQEGKAKKGSVTLTFTLTRLSENGNQVDLEHKLAYSRPTRRGKASEEDATSTPMYVSGSGALTLLPFKQDDLFGVTRADKSTA